MIPVLEDIKRLLYFEWDPISVSGIPEALDEYDSYALRVFGMLNEGTSAKSIADYLNWVVVERMGMCAPDNSVGIADRVVLIHLGHTGI